MKKAYYYIGSNNKTGELEAQRAVDIVGAYFSGFTAFEVVGYWKGHQERTLKVEVVTDAADAHLARVGKELRKELEQDSILLEIVDTNAAFIQ